MTSMKEIWIRGLKTGLGLAAATTAASMLTSDRETGSPWAAINAICHIVDGDDVEQSQDWSPRSSLLGVFINGAAMSTWGILYEAVLAMAKVRSNPLTGAVAAASAYVVDYHVVPKRLTPGFEKVLPPKSLLSIYLALGIAFALSNLWNKSPQP
jgi:hypothetical protein